MHMCDVCVRQQRKAYLWHQSKGRAQVLQADGERIEAIDGNAAALALHNAPEGNQQSPVERCRCICVMSV